MLVVAYCPGGSLHTHVNISLKEDGRGFDEHRAAFYVAEIAQAIAHLHSHGIVHRDLKLENVLVCVEINQSFLGDDAAVLARSSGEALSRRRVRATYNFDFHTGAGPRVGPRRRVGFRRVETPGTETPERLSGRQPRRARTTTGQN